MAEGQRGRDMARDQVDFDHLSSRISCGHRRYRAAVVLTKDGGRNENEYDSDPPHLSLPYIGPNVVIVPELSEELPSTVLLPAERTTPESCWKKPVAFRVTMFFDARTVPLSSAPIP